MSEEELEFAANSRERWCEVEKMQERLRHCDSSRPSLADAMAAFDMAFRSAIFRLEKRKTSGMVDFYRRMGIIA